MAGFRTNRTYMLVAAELDAAGIPFVCRTGGRHAYVEFPLNGQTTRVSVPKTPSDHRAAANARSRIRRLLRTGVDT